MVLEEYEQFFPKTKHVRNQLGFRRSQITDLYTKLMTDLMERERHDGAVAEMIAQLNSTSDYSALLEDLRIHVQNVSLAEITGGRIPERQPADPNVPIMVSRRDKMLDIVERGQSWPVRTYPPEAQVAAGTQRD
jgi:hypothetical protein